jgi:hypothetical protein
VVETRNEKVGAGVESLILGRRPESWPFARGTHGRAKVDCVTEWFPPVNWKIMVSPTFAVMKFGLNTREASAVTYSVLRRVQNSLCRDILYELRRWPNLCLSLLELSLHSLMERCFVAAQLQMQILRTGKQILDRYFLAGMSKSQ